MGDLLPPLSHLFPLSIDGGLGKGRGQVFRNALALSLGTGRDVHIRNIMTGRERPGLRPRDLVCLEAAEEIASARIDGAFIGSTEVTMHPGAVRPGEYLFDLKSGGSCTLLLQAVLPPLLYAAAPSVVTVRGATHTSSAPPYEFFEKSLLPLLCLTGARVYCRLERYGFHPAGGGSMTVFIEPAQEPRYLDFASWRGESYKYRSISILEWNLPEGLAAYEAGAVNDALWGYYQWRDKDDMQSWLDGHFGGGARVRAVPPEMAPEGAAESDFGNVVLWEEPARDHTRVITSFGGKSRESADKAALDIKGRKSYYTEYWGSVDRFLADQLVVPLALGSGGRYSCQKPTPHTLSALELVRLFSSSKAEASPTDIGRAWVVDVGGMKATGAAIQ